MGVARRSPFLGGVGRALLWAPRLVRNEFATRGGEPRFLMWVSFLVAFVWARTWVLYVGQHAPHFSTSQVQFGQYTAVFGYHFHHIVSGVLLLAIVGFILIHYQGKMLLRVMAVLYGVGLGLIVDEIGFIVGGIVPYENDFTEVFVLVVVISAIMMSSIYAPSFWVGVERRVKRLFARHARTGRRARREPVADAVPVPEPEAPARR
jgi:hypothetical protein